MNLAWMPSQHCGRDLARGWHKNLWSGNTAFNFSSLIGTILEARFLDLDVLTVLYTLFYNGA
jgi:hypothetical protein